MAKFPPHAIRAWRQVMHVHASVTTALDERLRREVGISGSWYEALVEIALAGGSMQMNEFARETTLTKSGATRFVDRLQRAGLVERTSCPTDRRVWQLSLTERGRELQRKADPHVFAVIEEHFGRFIDGDEADQLFELLSRMVTLPVNA